MAPNSPKRAFARARATLSSLRFRNLMIETAAWIETGDWTHNAEHQVNALRLESIADVAPTLEEDFEKRSTSERA